MAPMITSLSKLHVPACIVTIWLLASTYLIREVRSRALLHVHEDDITMSSSSTARDSALHAEWMAQYGRVYPSEAERTRQLEIFIQNVEFIESVNAIKNLSYSLSANEFADLTDDEFTASRGNGRYKPEGRVNISSRNSGTDHALMFMYGDVNVVPASIDWRVKGAVTPIKNQHKCGSCWAFSAVAAIEGLTKLKTGKLISLSEQQLVDCDVHGEDQGCRGGLKDAAFKFVVQHHGLTTDTDYPYTATGGKCNAKKLSNYPSAATISSYQQVPVSDEAALLKAVANQPVSVAVDSRGPAFRFYSKGVFSGECGTRVDHDVTVVGYGIASDGTKYWLVKNSWGVGWGEGGYIRMKRDVKDKHGLCGIAMEASFPIFAH